jgi:hypothetical protein
VATFPAQIAQQPFHASENAYVSAPGPDGSTALQQILIAKHGVQLNVEKATGASQPGAQGAAK